MDFGIILALLIANALIGFIEERKAESALDALRQTLALKSRAYRNGELVEVNSRELVPGDVIILRLGDIVPADCRYFFSLFKLVVGFDCFIIDCWELEVLVRQQENCRLTKLLSLASLFLFIRTKETLLIPVPLSNKDSNLLW